MKKVFVFILIMAFFLIGLLLGGNYHNSSQLFEDSKDKFEEEITKPGNNYSPSDVRPDGGLLNKIANKIDSIIEKVSKKLK